MHSTAAAHASMCACFSTSDVSSACRASSEPTTVWSDRSAMKFFATVEQMVDAQSLVCSQMLAVLVAVPMIVGVVFSPSVDAALQAVRAGVLYAAVLGSVTTVTGVVTSAAVWAARHPLLCVAALLAAAAAYAVYLYASGQYLVLLMRYTGGYLEDKLQQRVASFKTRADAAPRRLEALHTPRRLTPASDDAAVFPTHHDAASSSWSATPTPMQTESVREVPSPPTPPSPPATTTPTLVDVESFLQSLRDAQLAQLRDRAHPQTPMQSAPRSAEAFLKDARAKAVRDRLRAKLEAKE